MKKILSFILSFAMLLGTISVLTLLPAAAEETGPVNLLTNGDFSMGTWGDQGYETAANDSEDWGLIVAGNAYGWRSAGHKADYTPYSNASLYWYGQGVFEAGHPGQTDAPGVQINKWNQTMQDFKIEAGKDYIVSLDAAFLPTANGSNYTGWFDVVIADKAGVYIDAVNNKWPTVTNASYDLCDSGDSVYNTLYVDTSAENFPTFTYNDVTYWDFGDLKTYSFSFSADDVIAGYGLTDSDSDGYYDVTLGIQNNSSIVLFADNVSVYEAYTITAEDGGYITGDTDAATGESYTVTAVPYYGNTFLGWYSGAELVSTSATISGTLNKSLTAKFNVYNQIVDGSFEADNLAGQDFINAQANVSNGKTSVVIQNPTDSTAHGNSVLKVTPTSKNTNADFLTIPFTVKKNTQYVFHLSYYSVDTAYTGYVGLHSEKAFSNGWTKSTYVPSYTYHWELEGATNLNAWTVCGGINGSFGMMRDQTHATVSAGANKWIDYWLTFETGESDTIFEDGSDTANMFILFGVGNSVANTYYVDNISFTEAKATANSAVTALASSNGSVKASQDFIPDSVCYVDFGGAKKGSAATAVADSTRYSQVAVTTYTATPNSGYEFIGWFDAEGNLVSQNATETFYLEGVYTAKFASAPYAKDGGYITKNNDGTYTAKAYYGNTFKGWYDVDGKLITTEATLEKQVGMYADFAKYNLIDGGDFEDGVTNYYVQNANSSATVQTDSDGNKYLRMESTTTTAALYSFQWNFTLAKNKKYVISYRLRSGVDAEGNLLSTQDMAFRKMFLYDQGNRSYIWSDPLFAEQTSLTSGSKAHYLGTPDLLPSGGNDLNPSGDSTSFPGTYTYSSGEWTYYSYIFDTSSAVLADGTDISGNINLGMIFGANGAGHMVLDIDDISVSEVNNVVSFSDVEGGTAMVDRLASTAVIPATFMATPRDENYVFIGWVDENGDAVSSSNPYTTFEAENLTAHFAFYDPEGTTFQVNAKIEKQNGIYGGYLTGDKSATGVIGSTVTFTAVPYVGNTFDGWYVNGKKVSTNAQYTFYISGSADVFARFNINNLWSDAGYENVVRDTSILSDKALEENPKAYFEWNSYVPSLWWDAKVLTSKPYTGEASLELTHRNNEVLREVTGLQKNTDYELSFYWFIRNSLSAGAGSAPSYLKQVRFYDKNGKMFSATTLNAEYSADFQQSKVYFNSGEHTEIYVALTYYAGSSTIVCDDFCLIPGSSDEYVTVSYDSGDSRVGVITEMAKKGETYTVKAPYFNPVAKDFVNWTLNGNTYVKNDTLTLTDDVTFTANYTDFVSGNLVDSSSFDPDNYDFTLAVLPDEQKLLLQYPDYYVDITNWITANKDTYNIAGVLNMGDITEHGSYEQWYTTRQAFDSIIGEIPFGISLGNHDYANGGSKGAYNAKADRKTAVFNHFYKQSDFNSHPAWGGAYDDSMDNTYHKIEVGGVKIMIISLEIYPRYDVIKWAGELCKANPDYKVIVTTHAHLAADGTRSTVAESPYIFSNPEESSSPQELYDQLLKVYPNIIMLLCGHESSSATKVLTTKGDHGNTIHEILIDNQDDDINYRGVGNVMLMGFYDNGQMVDFTNYSTVQDKYFCPHVNEFTLALDKELEVEGYGDAKCDKQYVGENLIRIYSADPYYSNTFVGWYDADGNLVSKSATYSTATHNYLKAVFSGYNMIANGDFEDDAIPGIIFSNTNRLSITDFEKAEDGHGNRYLGYYTTTQETVQSGFKLPVNKNTDYSLSFDVKITDFGANGGLRLGFMYALSSWEDSAVIGGATQEFRSAKTGYVKSFTSEADATHRPGSHVSYSEYTDNFGDDWIRFTVNFNSGSDENVFGTEDKGNLYLVIHTLNNGMSMQIDNLVFATASAVIADAQDGGFANADKSQALIGDEITFTATPEYGNGFAGWFTAAGQPVSYDPVFTTTEHLHLVAKFKLYNSIKDGGFELGTTGDWFTSSSAVTLENVAHEGAMDSEFGGKYLKVTDNATGYLNFGLPIKAEPNTRYLVHFSFKVTSTTNSRIDITLSPKNSWGQFASSTTHFSTASASATDAGMYDNKYPNTIANTFGNGFIEANIIVDTAEELVDGETMYLLMGAKADGIYYIDNVSVIKVEDIAPSILGATLVSEAGKYKEGTISYKSQLGFIPTSSVLTEIGTLAMPTQLFSGELTWDIPNVSYAALSDSSGINLIGDSFYATFTNTDTINPSAKISARAYCKITDKYGKFNWTFYSENEDSAKAITNGTYNRSVNQVKRLLALALIERFEGNYPADFFNDDDVTETSNVKSSASVSTDKVWNFVKRNAHLLSGVNNAAPDEVNLINDGGFENDEFYLGGYETITVTDNSLSYTNYQEYNGIAYVYDHDGFIYYSGGDYYRPEGSTFDDFIAIDDSFAYTGNRSVRLSTRAGTVSYILDDLLPNTDYEFSYYWFAQSPVFLGRSYIYPHTYMNVGYDYVETIDIDGVSYRKYKYGEADYLGPKLIGIQANALDYTMGPIYSDNKWKKETLRFNSGNSTSVVFGLSYGSRVNSGTVWIDDLCLTQSDAPSDGIENSNFASGMIGWDGSASTYNIDGQPSATFTERGQFLKQDIRVNRYTDYVLTVKAKTSEANALYFGVTDAGRNALNPASSLTNHSSMTTDQTGTVTYKVGFSSGANSSLNVFLQLVCDSKVSIFSVEIAEADELVTYQTVDFEDSMTNVNGGIAPGYAVAKTNNLWYSLTSNVARSGRYSLRMAATSTDTNEASDVVTNDGDTLIHPLYQSWTSFSVNPGDYYTISYYAKAKTAGVSYESSIRGTDGSDWDYMQAIDKKTVTLSDTEWTLIEHTFANNLVIVDESAVNLVISANAGTTSDIYFDDITIKRVNSVAASGTVSEPYTESAYNLVTDGSFENGSSLYSGGSFVTASDAYDGGKYLRVQAGNKLIVPITTRVDYNYVPSFYYTLSGAIRASSGGAGYMTISATSDGNTPVLNNDGSVAKIAANGSAWNFGAFKYISPDVRPTYLVIECTSGYIDVDAVSFFSDLHAFANKPIESHEGYDYDDMSNAITGGGTAVSGAVSLSVNNTNSGIVNDTFSGVSATVYFPIIEDVMGRDMSEEQLDMELSRMKEAGIKRVRTMFKSQWAYTGDDSNPWDWNSSKMQEFYAWCKKLEEYDMDVMILAGWHLSSTVYGSSSISEVGYLAPRLLDANGEVQYAISWGIFHPVIDFDLAAERYATWMTSAINAIRDHGVTNMTHVLTFNEPSHQNGSLYQGAHAAQMLQLVDTLVDKMKSTYTDSTKKQTVRDSIVLVGPNQSGPSEHAGLAEYFVANSKYGYDLYDIWTTHLIEGAQDRTGEYDPAPMVGPDGDVYGEAYDRFSAWLSNLESVNSKFADSTFWCDEFASSGYGIAKVYDDEGQRWWGVKNAGQFVSLMNAGLSGGILWQFADCLWSYIAGSGGEFQYGIHMGGATTSLLQTQTPYYIYYSTSLLTKYLSCGDDNGVTYSSTSAHDNVHISTVKFADGNWSVLVVNNSTSAQNIKVNFASSIGGKNMYRHVYEAATVTPDSSATIIEADKTYTGVTTAINDNIPAGSVVVYTSIKG